MQFNYNNYTLIKTSLIFSGVLLMIASLAVALYAFLMEPIGFVKTCSYFHTQLDAQKTFIIDPLKWAHLDGNPKNNRACDSYPYKK